MNTSLLFGIHCHQPVDNFDWVIMQAIEKSYKPFFQTLKKFPSFKCSVHFSGSLFEFIEKNDPELFSLIQSLSNQIEFFSGGFYEPVLASIPQKDAIAQIKKLNAYIKKHFSQTPKGLWLTERVWDNSIIPVLHECGIKYVIVDDYHIKTSGINCQNLNGCFLTENESETIGLFPINQDLRYAVPFYSLEDTNKLLNSFANEQGKNAAIIFDDGEKFGVWPKTYETVYEKKWLEDFMKQTVEDKNIVIETYYEYFSRNKPIALTYLQTVSYFEMGEWSLNPKENLKLQELLNSKIVDKELLRGGTWKNFFTKYSESNWIHKRFLELSKKQTDDKDFLDSLYKAQCNDVLWHGVFGGIYLPNLRNNSYKYIIECEKILKKQKEKIDIDLDGFDEYKFMTDVILAIVSQKNGGQIFELDILEDSFNIQNTLTRYEEAYHKNIKVNKEDDQKEDTLKTIHDNILEVNQDISFDYDWYTKKSVIDHIVPVDLCIEEFAKNSFKEFGDFANQPFETVRSTKNTLSLKREGGIYDNGKFNTSLTKRYKFEKGKISIDINILSDSKDEYLYLQEWNLYFANLNKTTFNGTYLDLNEQYSFLEIVSNTLQINDGYLNKSFNFNLPNVKKIFISTLNTVSQSEQGVDITNQGITVGLMYDLNECLKVNADFNVTKY